MGFSQGAAALATLSLLKPSLFRGVALLAGFVPTVALDLHRQKFSTPQKLPRYFVGHGSLDETVPVSKAEEGATSLRGLGADATLSIEEVGHKVGSGTQKELEKWFAM